MNKYRLNNGIETIIKINKNTPRTAIVMFSQLNKDEEKAGLYVLLTRLLLQGTKNKTAEELANELDENAIEISFEKKADYLRFKILCLNEDINHALEIFEDIIENTTFADYQKEILKIKGEIESDLDSAKNQAQDNFYRTIFKNHPYGIGRKEILEQIDTITKEDIINAYNEIKYNTVKNIAVIGDINEVELIEMLNKHLKNIKVNESLDLRVEVSPLKEKAIAIIEKEDANQAQIFQGWIFPTIFSKEYPIIMLMNTILGSSGLSSRLFLELREKQGLCYNVRSVYEPYTLGGNFYVYIGTEPKNIKTSIEGFEKEINKIMKEVISDEELENAKNNTIGRRQFYQETNLLEAILKGYYESIGLGFDYEDKLIEAIKNTTKEEIIETASQYFSTPSAISILAPKKYLEEFKLI